MAQTEASPDHHVISGGEMKGTPVFDRNSHEQIGTIDYFAVERTSGSVKYAVVCFSGGAGSERNYSALPWDALEYDSALEGYRTKATKEDLRNYPKVEAASEDRQNWVARVSEPYGVTPNASAPPHVKSDSEG